VLVAWLDVLIGVPKIWPTQYWMRTGRAEWGSFISLERLNAHLVVVNLDGRQDGDRNGSMLIGGPTGSSLVAADRLGAGVTRIRMRGWPLGGLYSSIQAPWRAEFGQGSALMTSEPAAAAA
jgi:hypothetical protein